MLATLSPYVLLNKRRAKYLSHSGIPWVVHVFIESPSGVTDISCLEASCSSRWVKLGSQLNLITPSELRGRLSPAPKISFYIRGPNLLTTAAYVPSRMLSRAPASTGASLKSAHFSSGMRA